MMPLILWPMLALLSAPVLAESDLDAALGGFEESEPSVENRTLDELDSVIGGFDAKPDASSASVSEEGSDSRWELSGHIALESVYTPNGRQVGSANYRGFSSLKASTLLELEGEIGDGWKGFASAYASYDAGYALKGRSDYPDTVLDELEIEIELRELFFEGSPTTSTDLRLGRQIVTWGKSDNLRVVDVINPLDQRSPGMVDIEDLRLPLTMTRFDYFQGDWHLQTLLIHEQRGDKLPIAGGEYLPNAISLPEDGPANTLENTELGLALNGRFSGWDLSLYAASVYSDQPNFNGGRLERARLGMLGAAVNVALGNWLYKGELAWLDGLEFANTGGESGRIDLLQGVEYSGIAETSISFEVVLRHLTNYSPALANVPDSVGEDEVQWVVRMSRDFMNDQLQLTALISRLDWDGSDGGFNRVSLDYEIDSSWAISGGMIRYSSGDKPFYQGLDANNRLFAEGRYNF